MKIVSSGKVYDLSYGGYDFICRLPAGTGVNEVGVGVPVQKELRRDVASKRFYVYEGSSDYDRDRVAVREVSAGDAAAIAEVRLTYETYVKFFGEPEGSGERELAEAKKKADEAESSSKFWKDKASEKNARIAELERELARLKEAKQ